MLLIHHPSQLPIALRQCEKLSLAAPAVSVHQPESASPGHRLFGPAVCSGRDAPSQRLQTAGPNNGGLAQQHAVTTPPRWLESRNGFLGFFRPAETCPPSITPSGDFRGDAMGSWSGDLTIRPGMLILSCYDVSMSQI